MLMLFHCPTTYFCICIYFSAGFWNIKPVREFMRILYNHRSGNEFFQVGDNKFPTDVTKVSSPVLEFPDQALLLIHTVKSTLFRKYRRN